MSSSDSDSSSISSVEESKPAPKAPPAKKSSAASASAKPAAAKPSAAAKAGEKRKRQDSDGEGEGESRITIGPNRYVSLSNFRGKFYVDIREFYEDKSSGEVKPGKKGIALTMEQWDNLKRKVDDIDKMIKNA